MINNHIYVVRLVNPVNIKSIVGIAKSLAKARKLIQNHSKIFGGKFIKDYFWEPNNCYKYLITKYFFNENSPITIERFILKE